MNGKLLKARNFTFFHNTTKIDIYIKCKEVLTIYKNWIK